MYPVEHIKEILLGHYKIIYNKSTLITKIFIFTMRLKKTKRCREVWDIAYYCCGSR
jgi:hypothetical protein